jgi:hypothetical protein
MFNEDLLNKFSDLRLFQHSVNRLNGKTPLHSSNKYNVSGRLKVRSLRVILPPGNRSFERASLTRAGSLPKMEVQPGRTRCAVETKDQFVTMLEAGLR